MIAAVKLAISGSSAPVPARAKTVTGDGPAVQAALLLRRAMSAAGVSHRQLARAMSVSKSRVTAWCSFTHEASPNMRHRQLMRQKLPRLLHELLSLEQDRPVHPPPQLCQSRHLRLLMRELGEVADAVDEALHDETITPAEAAAIDKELADVAARVAAARRDLKKLL